MKKIMIVVFILVASSGIFADDLLPFFQKSLLDKLNDLVSEIRKYLSPLLTLGLMAAAFGYFKREEEGRERMRSAMKACLISLLSLEIVNLLVDTLT